jgi:hypothetical protein
MPTDFLQTTHRDIAWFKKAHEDHELEMKPPFQRNPVWTDKQNSYLIDTILNGYPVPELYLQDLVDENGNKKYIVVDGQQRVTACLDFVNGKFTIDANDSPTFANLSFDDLTPIQKKDVYRYQFVIRLLPEISDTELRDIFQRLNRNNVALNAQELRQATYWGPFIQTMNDLADLEIWLKIEIITNNDIKRMLDVEFISELSIAVLHGLQNKKTTIDKYYQIYEEQFNERSTIKEIFDVVLREIMAVLPNIGDTRWSKKTDFYTLFVLLARYRSKFPLPAPTRQQIGVALKGVGEAVDAFLTTAEGEGEPVIELSADARSYALNVRASSDLGARKKREEALDSVLAPFLRDSN